MFQLNKDTLSFLPHIFLVFDSHLSRQPFPGCWRSGIVSNGREHYRTMTSHRHDGDHHCFFYNHVEVVC